MHVQCQARSSYHLGYWADEAEAARAYDREILKVTTACFHNLLVLHGSGCQELYMGLHLLDTVAECLTPALHLQGLLASCVPCFC